MRIFPTFSLNRLAKRAIIDILESPPQWGSANITKHHLFKNNQETTKYYQIIQKHKRNPYRGPGEWHHIIPLSIGGKDTKENLIKVSYRTHLYLHHLLPNMCIYNKHRRSMIHAIVQMRKEPRYAKH